MKSPRNQSLNRFAELARLGEVVFHIDDLANLWHIGNRNTLYTTIKRYVAAGLLYRIYKGFYSLRPLASIDPLLLGVKAVHGYAYVSGETILAEQGIIQQHVPVITLLGSETKRFTVSAEAYFLRKLPDLFLYNPVGIEMRRDGVRKATVERAIADILFFNPRAYLDAASRIDWKRVHRMQNAVGYPLT